MWKYVFLFGLVGGLNFNYKLLKERRFQFYFTSWMVKTLIALFIGFINIIVREVPLDGIWLWTSGYFVFWLLAVWFIGLVLDFIFAVIDQDLEDSLTRYVTGFPWVCWVAMAVFTSLLWPQDFGDVEGKVIRLDFRAVQSQRDIVLNDPNRAYAFRACEIFPPREDNIFRLSTKEAIRSANQALADANLPGYEVRNLYLQLKDSGLCFAGPAQMRKAMEDEYREKGWAIESMPGYVILDASCRRNAEYIKHKLLVFDPEDACTHIYRGGGIYYTMHEACFKADPNGNPVWVSFLKRDSEKGLWADIAEGIMVLDAATKKVRHYSRDEMPDWMKIVLPPDVCTGWLKLFARDNGYGYYNKLGTFTNGNDVFLAYEIAKGGRYDSLAAVNRRTGDIMLARNVISADSDEAVKMMKILRRQEVTKSDAETICPVVLEEIGVSEEDPNNAVAWQRLVWAMSMEGGKKIALVSSNAFKGRSYYIGDYTDNVFRDFITGQFPGKEVK